ncbi:MAG: Spo0B domain-containing protein [Clostridiales bacterium]|nr:Spo0B domain-containing protein [Roseburia sp.]MDD7636003.1 Spo0B domain-containing protein [Clostridiales bacterium]MDY4114141.1 Spo0B domain-containing protein [Roseburia sp.]
MKTGLILCLLVALILMICILIILRQYLKLKRSYDAMLASYRNLEELNGTLRMQRHDYLNHLQVIYGMTELEEYDELKRYLDPLYKDMMKTGKALRTAKPAINALIRAKSSEAENSNIDVYIEVKSDLKALEIPDWELCKVLSNIIDNGITALKLRETDKKLWIDITETQDDYRFVIANNGPMIAEKQQSEIFKQGVTTKSEEGHGMGLFIASNVMKYYKGKITLKSDEEQTCFQITLPKKK